MRILFIAAALMLTGLVSAGDEPVVGEEASIKIRRQHLFPRPVFYATPIAELEFGDIVTLLEQNGDWYRISTENGETGWVHATAVTGAVLAEGQVASGSGEITSDEIMLAGRGFNSDVENNYKNSNPNLSFEGVNLMESTWVSPDEIYTFLLEGELLPEGGEL